MATKARQLSSVPGTFRNKIINGDFDIWQRGISQTSSGYGSDDRWQNRNDVSTKSASRQAFTVGQTDVPHNPKYYSRTVVTSNAGAAPYVAKQQAIEGVDTFSGEIVTLSFYAKADAAKNIAIEFAQQFGGGGGSSWVPSIGAQKIALTTSWAKYTATITIPSISGKTIGTDGDDRLEVWFWFDADSTYDARTDSLGQQSGTFDIAQVQVEAGPVATEFEQRDIGTELALCQRYYAVLDTGHGGYADGAGYTAGNMSHVTYPVTMRAIPSIAATVGLNLNYAGHNIRDPQTTGSIVNIQATAGGARVYAEIELALDAEL